jgi:Flp pilus assembly secretin CpaC
VKYRLWLNVPARRLRMISDDLDSLADAEILGAELLKALPDSVVGIDMIENRSVGHGHLRSGLRSAKATDTKEK